MNKKIFGFSGLFLVWFSGAIAQQNDSIYSLKEVVISDSRFALPKEKSGKVIEVITAEDLKNSPGQTVADVLNTVAGVEVNGNQTTSGKNIGYYVRGGRNRQTLILIDGVPVTDATGINLEYDLRLLSVDQIESIEIMKGASSTLYGSGAATGVINITLKKASDKRISGNVYLNIGTQNEAERFRTQANDYNQGFSVNGTVNKVTYFASLNSTETKGLSQTTSYNKDIRYEEDPFSRINYLVKLGYAPTSRLSLNFFANFDRIKNDFDDSFDNVSDTDNLVNTSTTQQYRLGFTPKYKYKKGELVLNASFNGVKRTYEQLNSWTSTIDMSHYKSRSVNADLFNKYTFTNQIFVVTGTDFQFHDANIITVYNEISKDKAKFSSVDPYVTAVYTSDFGFNLNTGARLTIHSVYDNHMVFNVNPSFNFGGENPLKLLASYSTAYITPSIYQLYSPYGNLDLTPEENATVETGFEIQLLNKKLSFNAVGFYREQTNTIGFYTNPINYVSNYANVDGTFTARGIETEVTYSISDLFKLRANYTFTETEEALNLLVPKHKVNASFDYFLNPRVAFNISYQYVDSRNDAYYDGGTFQTETIVLGSYQLLNGMVRYELLKNRLSVFGSVNNMFNVDFIENIGYTTKGRNVKLGLNLKF